MNVAKFIKNNPGRSSGTDITTGTPDVYLYRNVVRYKDTDQILGIVLNGRIYVNGDDEGFALQIQNPKDGITFSFRCLGRFLTLSSSRFAKTAAHAILNGRLIIKDYVDDDRIKIPRFPKSGQAIEQFKATAKPPKPGYTLVGSTWHRPATILFFDTKIKNSILLGMDEGSYFGVELKGSLKTINDAYTALIPKECRGKNCPRQGEWFFLNVPHTAVPKHEKCIALAEPECYDHTSNLYAGFAMPVDNEHSSRHVLASSSETEIRIDSNGNIYCHNPCMKHSREQHTDVYANGWYTFRKNNALRAFSEQGVD